MIPVRSILAATDLTASGDVVIRTAAGLARAFDADLHVVHVAAPWDEDAADHHTPTLDAQVRRSLAALPAGAMSRNVLEASGALPEDLPDAIANLRLTGWGGRELEVDTAVVCDRPFHGILVRAAAVGADLIVVGAHRGSETTARWGGTTAERVVRAADVPCLVVNRPMALPLRRVGVAVDSTPSSRGGAMLAVDWLPQLAGSGTGEEDRSGRKTPLVSLVHVRSGGTGTEEDAARMTAEIDRVRGNHVNDEPSGVHVESVLRSGTDAAREVAAWAETSGTELLVVAAEGRRGLSRLWSGSPATATSVHAPCPVLLVPPALWRRSPIPLARVATAIDPQAGGGRPRTWIERRVTNAHRPLQLVHLDPQGDVVRQALDADADLLVVHDAGAEVRSTPTPGTAPRVSPLPVPVAPSIVTLLEHTPVPVLLLRDLPEGAIRRILVAVDTGDIWYEKFGWAKLLADRFDAHVTIYHAIDLSINSRVRREPGGEFVPAVSVWMKDNVEKTVVPAMRTWLWERARLAGLRADRVDVVVGLQTPGYAIPMLAQQTRADLVIVAAHAEDRVGRVPLSRVATATLEGGTYSTLVVVDRARREAERLAAVRAAVR